MAAGTTTNSTVSPGKGLTFALTSGVLASFAGLFGKFAMTQSETVWYCESVCTSSMFELSSHDAYDFCDKRALYIRALAFVLMIIINAIMLTTFVKALRYCHTSLEATVTNTAANFFASAVVGRLLFDESMSLMWWLGTLLIIFGLGLMTFSAKGGTLKAGSLFGRHKKRKMR